VTCPSPAPFWPLSSANPINERPTAPPPPLSIPGAGGPSDQTACTKAKRRRSVDSLQQRSERGRAMAVVVGADRALLSLFG
jgi:hypothetical protein